MKPVREIEHLLDIAGFINSLKRELKEVINRLSKIHQDLFDLRIFLHERITTIHKRIKLAEYAYFLKMKQIINYEN